MSNSNSPKKVLSILKYDGDYYPLDDSNPLVFETDKRLIIIHDADACSSTESDLMDLVKRFRAQDQKNIPHPKD